MTLRYAIFLSVLIQLNACSADHDSSRAKARRDEAPQVAQSQGSVAPPVEVLFVVTGDQGTHEAPTLSLADYKVVATIYRPPYEEGPSLQLGNAPTKPAAAHNHEAEALAQQVRSRSYKGNALPEPTTDLAVRPAPMVSGLVYRSLTFSKNFFLWDTELSNFIAELQQIGLKSPYLAELTKGKEPVAKTSLTGTFKFKPGKPLASIFICASTSIKTALFYGDPRLHMPGRQAILIAIDLAGVENFDLGEMDGQRQVRIPYFVKTDNIVGWFVQKSSWSTARGTSHDAEYIANPNYRGDERVDPDLSKI